VSGTGAGYEGGVTLRLTLPGEPLAAREARRAVTSWALSHGFGVGVDDLELVTGELVANAASHGTGSVTLEAMQSDGRVRLRVTDEGAVAPQVQLPSDDDESGRGLMIVAALALDWGSSVGTNVTEVWAELRLGHDLPDA